MMASVRNCRATGVEALEREESQASLVRQLSRLGVLASFVPVAFTMTKDNLRVKGSKSQSIQQGVTVAGA